MAEINEQLSLDIDGIKTIMLDRQTDSRRRWRRKLKRLKKP